MSKSKIKLWSCSKSYSHGRLYGVHVYTAALRTGKSENLFTIKPDHNGRLKKFEKEAHIALIGPEGFRLAQRVVEYFGGDDLDAAIAEMKSLDLDADLEVLKMAQNLIKKAEDIT